MWTSYQISYSKQKRNLCAHFKEMNRIIKKKKEKKKKTVVKDPKYCIIVEPILLAYSSWYMVQSWFSQGHYLLSKQGSTLKHFEYRT